MNRKTTFLFLLIAMTIGMKTFAQTEPTLNETVEWIRGKILAYGYQTRDVTFDKSNYTLTITTQNPNYSSDKGYDVVYLSNLNASSFAWEVFNKDIIRVTIPAVSSKIARDTDGDANPKYRSLT